MSAINFKNLGVNRDLQKERDGASFRVEEFQAWWHGGAKKLQEKREIEEFLYADLEDPLAHEYQSHKDVYETALRTSISAAKKVQRLQALRNPGGNDIWPKMFLGVHAFGLMPAHSPFATHATMFIDVIRSQGTPEQIEKFGKRAERFNIIGTYAQTELSHGTNVRGIKTRADYCRETDEFILNTPSLDAYKWWPGGLGHTSNYAMVVAQLYIEEAHKGIQMFIVQIRDEETHVPLPGVIVGEIGKKLGMAGVNQGYLAFENKRIPRENMLMRNAKVMRDGTFVQSPASKLAYMTMVYTRCLIVNQNTHYLAAAATIATRYAAVRRQSPINPNDPEPQILDHVTQQLKLIPEIATAIAYTLSAQHMWSIYDLTTEEISRGEYSRLREMHILTCALKALCTTDSCAGIERLRLACGGHGYLTAANFGTLYGNGVAAYTYEGENTVLLLQVGRFLVKAWQAYTTGVKLPASVDYFERISEMGVYPNWKHSVECLIEALQFTAAYKVRIAYQNLKKRINAGQTPEEATNNTGIELTQAAELHGRQFLATTFYDQVTGPKASDRSPDLNRVLRNVLELFLLHSVQRHMNDILRFIPLNNKEIGSIQTRLENVLRRLRPEAVAICDGFDFHDRALNSVLGAYDGNVYERLFESTKVSPLNHQPVPEAFEKLLKPFLKSNL